MKTIESLQLTLTASGLRNVSGIFKGTSDPFAIVTLLASDPGEKPRVLGKTEVIRNTLSPQWTTSFVFDYSFGKETHINVSIVDNNSRKTDKPMGSVVFEIGDILGSRGGIKAKNLKRGGIVYARIKKCTPQSAGKLALCLRGIKLKSVEGMFKKSDPFYELRRIHDGPMGGSWTPVHRSNYMKDNLNPKWEPATIDVNALCDGNLDRKLQVAIFDFEKDGKHESMGTFETTVSELLKAAISKATFTPRKGSTSYGTIVVDECKITGADTHTSPTITQSTTYVASTSIAPIPVPSSNFGTPVVMPVSPPHSKPTFVDYVSGNCNLSLCVAIDFTGSNGDPRRPGTLHYISHDGSLNGYEKAMTAVGGILSKYDSDQRFPVWGFGAKYDGIVRHCFQVGKEKDVHGVTGMLEAYRGVFNTPLTMSGPTVFTEVIELAATQARSRQQLKPLSYTILLLLTDGAVTDVEATKKSLRTIADAPLSIVIVGIGNADFSAMNHLDDFENRASTHRDIVQFVKFCDHEFNKTSLTRATLDEIPDQLVQFFFSRGIMPQPTYNLSTSKIVAEDANPNEEEIDLSMEHNPDGEIVLNGNQSAAYIDNSYEATLARLKIIPPPSAPPMSSPSAPLTASVIPVQQPLIFQVQCPPGATAGMQLQVKHPQTGQILMVVVPNGIAPGGVFNVSS